MALFPKQIVFKEERPTKELGKFRKKYLIPPIGIQAYMNDRDRGRQINPFKIPAYEPELLFYQSVVSLTTALAIGTPIAVGVWKGLEAILK